jgi:hypothetical protein
VLSACQAEETPQGEEAYNPALAAVHKSLRFPIEGSPSDYRLVLDLKKVAENSPIGHNLPPNLPHLSRILQLLWHLRRVRLAQEVPVVGQF